jgi:transposase
MPRHKSSDYKQTAVDYYLIGDKTQEGTCKIFKCSPRSLMRWVNMLKTEGEISRQSRDPIAYKVKEQHVSFILKRLEKDNTLTMSALLDDLKREYPDFDLSLMHLWRIVRDNNITLKAKHVRHVPISRFGKPIDINEKLKDFYTTIKGYAIDDIISIDETSINAFQVRNRCYSRKGKRCVVKTQSQEVFKKYTAIFAISTKGVLGWELYEKGGIEAERLSEFLTKYITTKYSNKVVVLDNAGAHRNEQIRTLVNKDNHLLYSVPYQHFTNAIEGYFSVLKSHLRKMPGLKYTELKTNIRKVVDAIPTQYYNNLFNGAYNREGLYKKQRQTRKRKQKKYLD